jgi:hypothetical protein
MNSDPTPTPPRRGGGTWERKIVSFSLFKKKTIKIKIYKNGKDKRRKTDQSV